MIVADEWQESVLLAGHSTFLDEYSCCLIIVDGINVRIVQARRLFFRSVGQMTAMTDIRPKVSKLVVYEDVVPEAFATEKSISCDRESMKS